ncbi:MAG: serine/threonine protein kinase [Blastocatellia bacterium]|nr:serine/threonine protein kinase [Blastocatellia bacterium]
MMIDQTLSHYRITSKLGSGGMGDVYLAEDIGELERTVALKVIPAELAADPQRMQRFVQEARAVSALNHPNILTVFEFGQEGETRFIATEYVEGKTLRQYSNEASLGASEVLDIATQIAAALDAAHGKGVVHRDIKPENVMVRKDGIIEGARLWPGEAGRAGTGWRCGGGHGSGYAGAHGAGTRDGDGAVHVTGAGAGNRGRCAVGRLESGCGGLRNALRAQAVRG